MNNNNNNNAYENEADMEAAVDAGRHRQVVGDMWEEIGALQFCYLVGNGLKPEHRLIDIGCGSLRGGVRFVPYLNSAHYYGIDISRALLTAGYQREIVPAGLGERLPLSNLRATPAFDIAWPHVAFDFGIAQSLFYAPSAGGNAPMLDGNERTFRAKVRVIRDLLHGAGGPNGVAPRDWGQDNLFGSRSVSRHSGRDWRCSDRVRLVNAMDQRLGASTRPTDLRVSPSLKDRLTGRRKRAS